MPSGICYPYILFLWLLGGYVLFITKLAHREGISHRVLIQPQGYVTITLSNSRALPSPPKEAPSPAAITPRPPPPGPGTCPPTLCRLARSGHFTRSEPYDPWPSASSSLTERRVFKVPALWRGSELQSSWPSNILSYGQTAFCFISERTAALFLLWGYSEPAVTNIGLGSLAICLFGPVCFCRVNSEGETKPGLWPAPLRLTMRAQTRPRLCGVLGGRPCFGPGTLCFPGSWPEVYTAGHGSREGNGSNDRM